MPTLINRGASSDKDIDSLFDESSAPTSSLNVENQENTNVRVPPSCQTMWKHDSAGDTSVEADQGQSDRFRFPEWAASYMDVDAEFKELCLNIQQAARMEARATEIRATLSHPEARTIINLIEELNYLEADPLRQQLYGALGKLHFAMCKYNSATRLMQDFGLSVAPRTDSRIPAAPAASPIAMSGTSPATGVPGCGSSLVEQHIVTRPAVMPATTGFATEGRASSSSPQVLGDRVGGVHDSASSTALVTNAAPRRSSRIARKDGTDRSAPGTTSGCNMAKGSAPPASQTHLSSGENGQVDSHFPTKNENAQGPPDDLKSDDKKGENTRDNSEEMPREPAYHQRPGESSHVAQARYIQNFQKYQNKMAAYRKRTEDGRSPRREREPTQPSESHFKRLRRGR